MSDRRLIFEKLDQVTAILNEFDIDVWLTFVRESSMATDPALELIYDGDVTWQSAFLIGRDGRRTAIIGHFDADGYLDLVGASEDTNRIVWYRNNGARPPTFEARAIRNGPAPPGNMDYAKSVFAADTILAKPRSAGTTVPLISLWVT